MKNSNLTYRFVIALLFFFSGAQAQQTFRTTSTSVIGYLEYLPQDYVNNSDQYPIVIFLHGLGEVGSTSTDPVELAKTIPLVKKNGPPKHVENGIQFPFILISPQLKSNYTNWPSGYVNEVINYCKTYLRIDERRIYLTGLSLGGGGTWWTAQDYPKSFAAIAPVCGSRNLTSKAINIAGENLPVWAFHGESDTTVPVSRTVNMVNAINACLPTPNPLAIMTLYPGVGHNAWDNANKPDHTIHNPNVYDWMLSFTNKINGGNTIPTANAGTDVIKYMPTTSAVLTGSASDIDDTVSSYIWSQFNGPSSATLSNASTKALTISNLVVGIYIFKLKVTDNGGEVNSDYVMVTILPKTENLAPVANAGMDTTITLPTNSVTLIGSGTDMDGTIASYKWTAVSGTAATLSGISTKTLSVSSLAIGKYVFRLEVTDNLGATQADDVTVNVLDGKSNLAPIAYAGPDRMIKLPSDTQTLPGTASDADGTVVSYNWKKVSGGSCTFSSTSVLRPKISNLTNGTYVFRLTLTDNGGAVTTDDVVYVASHPPTVNAGIDYSLTLPTNSITLNGSATDSDGIITTYLWVKYSGPTVSMINKTTPSSIATKLLEGTYVFRLTATDDAGFQSIDYATVVVQAEIIQTTSLGRVASKEVDAETQEPLIDEPSTFVFDKANESIENCLVIVYNGAGEILFNGVWKAERYNEIFNHEGLYIYKIMKDGKRLTGKLYITENR